MKILLDISKLIITILIVISISLVFFTIGFISGFAIMSFEAGKEKAEMFNDWLDI